MLEWCLAAAAAVRLSQELPVRTDGVEPAAPLERQHIPLLKNHPDFADPTRGGPTLKRRRYLAGLSVLF